MPTIARHKHKARAWPSPGQSVQKDNRSRATVTAKNVATVTGARRFNRLSGAEIRGNGRFSARSGSRRRGMAQRPIEQRPARVVASTTMAEIHAEPTLRSLNPAYEEERTFELR